MVEHAEPGGTGPRRGPDAMASARHAPRRYSGKHFAIALVAFLALGTALTTYFAWKNELARQRALDAPPEGAVAAPH